MANEFFKSGRGGNYSAKHYTYSAVGPEYRTEPDVFDEEGVARRNAADIDVVHRPSRFIVPYTNVDEYNYLDPEGVTGLSYDYLSNLSRKLNLTPTIKLDDEDHEAKVIVNNLSEYGSPQDMEKAKQLYNESRYRGNKHFEPDKLFEYKPSSIEITSMFAHPEMRTSAVHLAAIAKRDLGAETVIASDDLSPHSSRLTKKAQELGFPVEANTLNQDADVTNTYDFHNKTIRSEHLPSLGEPVSPEVVAGAKKDVRELIRKSRTVRNPKPVTQKGLGDQFHPVLPGMEGFV